MTLSGEIVVAVTALAVSILALWLSRQTVRLQSRTAYSDRWMKINMLAIEHEEMRNAIAAFSDLGGTKASIEKRVQLLYLNVLMHGFYLKKGGALPAHVFEADTRNVLNTLGNDIDTLDDTMSSSGFPVDFRQYMRRSHAAILKSSMRREIKTS